MPEPQDHDALYHRLGLEPGASQAEVAQAYRRLVHGVHPDAHPGDPGAPARFRLLREAYEALADPRRRADYDRWRLRNAAEQREGRLAAGMPVSVLGVQVVPVDPHTQMAALRVGPVHVTPLPDGPGGREAAWGSAAPPQATALIVLAGWMGFSR